MAILSIRTIRTLYNEMCIDLAINLYFCFQVTCPFFNIVDNFVLGKFIVLKLFYITRKQGFFK